MSFDLRIRFEGLTPLVPGLTEEEAAAGSDPPSYLVPIPDLQRGLRLAGAGGWKRELPPHQALLAVEDRFVVDGGEGPRKAHHATLQVAGEPLRRLYRFERERLSVEEGEPGLTAVRGLADGEAPASSEEARDLRWVPEIRRIEERAALFDGAAHLGRDVYEGPLPEETLAGLVVVDRGELASDDVIRQVDGDATLYAFAPPGSGSADDVHRQAFARSIVWTIRVEAAAATLRWTQAPGEAAGDLLLDPRGEEAVEVTILNRELEEVLGIDVQPLTESAGGTPSAPPPDPDFLVFYWLSTAWATGELVPAELPLPRMVSEGGGGKAKACEPAQYSAVGS